MLASALLLCEVGPATVLSHKCHMPSLLKDDQISRDNRLPVHCRHLASRRHRTAIPVATQMSLPPVCLPLFKRAQDFRVPCYTNQHHGLNGPFPLPEGPFSDLRGDPKVEASRSYQSLVTPLFRGMRAPKTLGLLCFGAIREGGMICDRSLLTS